MTARKPPDDSQIAQHHWPVDGPYSPDTLLSATRMLGNLVEYANHATLNATGATLPHPAVVAAIAGHVNAAANGLEQLFEQLASRCQWWKDADSLVTTSSTTTASRELTVAHAALDVAAVNASGLKEAASRAQCLLNRLAFPEV